MAGSWRSKRPIPKGRCQATPGCPNTPKGFNCPRHQAIANKNQNKRRGLHRRLGFCIFCTARAVSGHTRCEKHLKAPRENSQAIRDRNAAKRGWKWVRVPVREASDGKRRSAGRPR